MVFLNCLCKSCFGWNPTHRTLQSGTHNFFLKVSFQTKSSKSSLSGGHNNNNNNTLKILLWNIVFTTMLVLHVHKPVSRHPSLLEVSGPGWGRSRAGGCRSSALVRGRNSLFSYKNQTFFHSWSSSKMPLIFRQRFSSITLFLFDSGHTQSYLV